MFFSTTFFGFFRLFLGASHCSGAFSSIFGLFAPFFLGLFTHIAVFFPLLFALGFFFSWVVPPNLPIPP